MTRYGTSHFVSEKAAFEYFLPYGYDAQAVKGKITSGDIHIGKPEYKPYIRYTVDTDGRYIAIEIPHAVRIYDTVNPDGGKVSYWLLDHQVYKLQEYEPVQFDTYGIPLGAQIAYTDFAWRLAMGIDYVAGDYSFKNMKEVREANQANGDGCLSSANLKATGRKIESRLFGGRFFVMSESIAGAPIAYSVWQVLPTVTAGICIFEDKYNFSSLEWAKTVAKHAAKAGAQ
jgi:hypothetical protein